MSNMQDKNDSAGSGDPTSKLQSEARQAGETVKSEAKAVADHAGEAVQANAEAGFEKGKRVAEDQLGTLSSAVDDAAERLEAENHPLASYAGELSTQLGNLSDVIENSTLDEVAGRAHRLARQNPGLFMLGSVALGFAASRFIKASDDRDAASSAVNVEHRGARVSHSAVGGGDDPYRRNETSTPGTRSAFDSPTAEGQSSSTSGLVGDRS